MSIFGDKIPFKSSPNKWRLLGIFIKNIIFKEKHYRKFGLLFISTSSHNVSDILAYFVHKPDCKAPGFEREIELPVHGQEPDEQRLTHLRVQISLDRQRHLWTKYNSWKNYQNLICTWSVQWYVQSLRIYSTDVYEQPFLLNFLTFHTDFDTPTCRMLHQAR